MSSRIKGLTIEIDGNTTKLNDALKSTDKQISDTNKNLKDVNKLLKFDPSNTDLLKQKQKLLADAVGETKDRLQKLKDAQAQMDTAGIDKSSDAYMGLQREIADTEEKLKSLKKEQTDFGSANLQAVSANIDKIGQKATETGSKLTAGVTAPIVAVGAAAVKAYDEVDAGADIVATKTGATGKALADMQDIANDLAQSIPVDFDDAGTAVGEVNTRFQLTGDALKETSGQFLKFSKITGQEVNSAIDGTSQAMAAFDVQAEQAPAVLDLFAAASQRTGADVGQLQSDLLANATGFRDLGLSITDSVNLLADMQKSGVESSDVLKGLTKAQQNAAKDGKSMSDELTTAFSSQADMIDVFGSKAGAKLWDAFQQGKISAEDFISTGATLDGTLGTVSQTFENTQDPADKWKETMNQLKVAGADLAETIMPQLSAIIQAVSERIKDAKTWWDGLSDSQQKHIVHIAEFIAVAGPLLVVFGKISSAISGIIALFAGFNPIVAIVIAAIAALILIITNWGSISDWIVEKWGTVKNFFGGLWGGMNDGAGDAVEKIKGKFSDAAESINGFFSGIKIKWPKIKTPHFTNKGNKKIGPLTLPDIDVEWYKKAMNRPYLLDGATIFGYAGGRLLGGGESGQEVITSKADYDNRGNVTNNITIVQRDGESMSDLADRISDRIAYAVQRKAHALGG